MSDIRRHNLATHPWITFTFSVTDLPPRVWMLLGEARSKCDHIAGVPLKPAIADELHQLFLAKGALATTAIEGNTLTEHEVRAHLEGKLKLSPSRAYLGKEIDNIVVVCNQIAREVTAGRGGKITQPMIKGFNKQILEGLPIEKDVVPGAFRDHNVTVGGGYRGVPFDSCDHLSRQLCEWLNGPDFRADEKQQEMILMAAVLRAIIAHLYLAWIHPFGDGNGRTARLVEFQILVAAGLPTPAAHLLSNHYNQTRAEYYRQLRAASESGGDVVPFIEYAVAGFVEGLRDQLQLIRVQQLDGAWQNYVHEKFRERKSPSDHRRRRLVLDLSEYLATPVPRAKLREISPLVARDYAGKTEKTLSRDLNILEGMKLVRREADGYVAAREAILAFLPILPLAPPSEQLELVQEADSGPVDAQTSGTRQPAITTEHVPPAR